METLHAVIPWLRRNVARLSRRRRRNPTDATDEPLICPSCGSDTMHLIVRQHDVDKLKCAKCGDLVAYASGLIRVNLERRVVS
ncbi:MAG TPA: hypothetical protein VGR40_00280 [Candidatus Binatus sp.]|nr:hypothetical protein [Candidatus Binatus sp.]